MRKLKYFKEFCRYLEKKGVEDLDSVILYVGYNNAEDEYHEFHITNIDCCKKYGNRYFDAYCIDKDGETEDKDRTFKIDRFDWIEVTDDEYDDDD